MNAAAAVVSPAQAPGVRRLQPADAPTYRALMLEAYASQPDAFTATVEERGPLPLAWWEHRVADAADATELVMGAFESDGLIGVAGLAFQTRPKSRHKATLFGMFVASGARGRGIGRMLVEAVLACARERGGIEVVQLTVTDGNRAAQTLYERCGFIAFGVEPFAMRSTAPGGFDAKVHMWRRVGTP